MGTVVDNFLIPVPEPSGICSDGTSFWIPNYAAVTGNQDIYKIDIWTRKITDSIRSLDSTPTGLAWDGKGIWVLATPFPTSNRTSLVRLSTSDSILSYIPAIYSCYWAGIAWDGRNLYYGTNVCFASDSGSKSMVYKANPSTGAIIDSFPPPSGNINGLVYNRGNLWYCDDNVRYFFEVDTTGNVLKEFPLSKTDVPFGGLLTGITIAKGYLWAVDIAGAGGPRIYEIDIGEAPAIPQPLGGSSGPDIPGKIRLDWLPSSSPDVEWYRIYRDGPLYKGSGSLTNASLIDSVRSNRTTYIDSSVPNGLFYAYWVSAVDSDGVESYATYEGATAAWPPLRFKLGQNYPNPFSPTTTIPYEVPDNGDSFEKITTHINITVYDALGRKVATLVDEEENPGEKTVGFYAANLPSGIYFCRMRTETFTETIKLVLIR